MARASAPPNGHKERTPMLVDVLREAGDENEIYCLLTAYIDASRFCHRHHFMSEPVMRLPVTHVDDVRTRFESLVAELDAASKALDDSACVVLRDALHVFGTALHGLRQIGSSDDCHVTSVLS